MSKAIQCDRCKRCFSPKAMKTDEYFLTIKLMYDQTAEDYDQQKYKTRYEELNLCDACTKDFYIFMNILHK